MGLKKKTVFSCTPVAAFWDLSLADAATCIDSSKFYIGITVPNIIFDFLTVALPVHEVWSLQMGRDKKLAISGVFLLGGSVILASFARLILFSVYRPGGGESGNNISQTVVLCHMASAIETTLAIIGACLPPCAPLLKRVFGGVVTRGSRTAGAQSGSSGSGEQKGNFHSIITIGKISNRSKKRDKNPLETDFDLEGTFVRLEEDGLSSAAGPYSGHGSTDELYGANANGHDRDFNEEGGLKTKRGSQIGVANGYHDQGKKLPVDGVIKLKDISGDR